MTIFTVAAAYAAKATGRQTLEYVVNADGYEGSFASLDEVRAYVAGLDASRGRCRVVTVAKVVNGYVVATTYARDERVTA